MGSPPATEAHAHPHGRLEHDNVAHERSDVSIRGLLWFVVTLAVIVAILQLFIWGLMKVFNRIEVSNDPYVSPLATPASATPTDSLFAEPRLQTTPWLDLKEFRAGEDAYLNSYGWVDQKGGVAHLPIEKAKALLLQRGLPARAGQQDPMEGTHSYAYGESSGGRSIPAGGADQSSAQPTQAGEVAPKSPQGAKAGGGQ